MNSAGPAYVLTSMKTSYAREENLVRALYREHAAPLLAYVRTLVTYYAGRTDDTRAEDIVAETLLRAARRPGDLAPDTARAWLFRVARDLVYERGQRPGGPPGQARADTDAGATTYDDVQQALIGWQVAEALHSMSASHREVLVELYFRDRPVDDVARWLRIRDDAVRAKTYYALRSLHLALEERGVANP